MSILKLPTVIKKLWWVIPIITLCLIVIYIVYKVNNHLYIKRSINNPFKEASKQTTNGAPIICEPSIKSLEQELKICFYYEDKCTELLNSDISVVITIDNYEKERNYWKSRAFKEANKTTELIDKLNDCERNMKILLE